MAVQKNSRLPPTTPTPTTLRSLYIPHANTLSERNIARKTASLFALVLLSLLIAIALNGPKATVMIMSLSVSIGFTLLIAIQAGLRGLAIAYNFAPRRFVKNDSVNGYSEDAPQKDDQDKQDDQDWPLYTVLVPLRNEAHMLPEIIRNLSELDYPRSRLQILLITEGDDPATSRAAAENLIPPFEVVIVPRSVTPPSGTASQPSLSHNITGGPRTKPNALNFAMTKAIGEIITIYDAEDSPHPAQLKTAVRAFRAHPHWGALQAPLDYFNADETWLTAQFALEYAAQFHIWIPFMARLRMPFPLGGTSNHMRASALEAVGGWDSYNVTEDADLSFRLAAFGYGIGYITPATNEEAVATLKPWTAQRTRWMKGFLQSWLVHMHRPLAPGGWTGMKRQITLQLTLGTVLLAGLLHTPICIGVILWASFHCLTQGSLGLPSLVYLSIALGYGSGICVGIAGALRAGKPRLIAAVWLMPLYWLLLFIPSWLAVYEFWQRPFYWAKTEHGLTRRATAAKPAAPRTIPQEGL